MWKRFIGLINVSTKNEINKVLTEEVFRLRIKAKAKKLNIETARMTEGESPAINANPHKINTMSNDRIK